MLLFFYLSCPELFEPRMCLVLWEAYWASLTGAVRWVANWACAVVVKLGHEVPVEIGEFHVALGPLLEQLRQVLEAPENGGWGLLGLEAACCHVVDVVLGELHMAKAGLRHLELSEGWHAATGLLSSLAKMACCNWMAPCGWEHVVERWQHVMPKLRQLFQLVLATLIPAIPGCTFACTCACTFACWLVLNTLVRIMAGLVHILAGSVHDLVCPVLEPVSV